MCDIFAEIMEIISDARAQVDEVRKEALEVREHLAHTPRDAHTPRADEPRKEALDVLAHLRERSMRSERSVRTPREDRIVEAAMARQVISAISCV